MKIISFIENPKIIKKILKYLNLWDEERDSQLRTARDPPRPPEMPDEIVYVPVEDSGLTSDNHDWKPEKPRNSS